MAMIIAMLNSARFLTHFPLSPFCLKMMLETSNNLTGTTTNPHNTALTPGGSSGGESALQALRGSPLGIGTDIGIFESSFCSLRLCAQQELMRK